MIRAIILSACFLGLQAAVLNNVKSACPAVTTEPEFNYIPYAGTWYEFARFENTFQEGYTCVAATYAEIETGVVSVENIGITPSGEFSNNTHGKAYAANPDEPGRLTVEFPDFPNGSYLVLDTDYTSYSAVYSCSSASIYKFEFEYAWILTRERVPTQAAVDAAKAAFTSFGIDVNKFQTTFQGDTCFYAPPQH